MHFNHMQLSSKGELIVPASVVIEHVDMKATIFSSSNESN